jgi:hypothetical protein
VSAEALAKAEAIQQLAAPCELWIASSRWSSQ